jgi:hypothetical protein
MQWTFVHRICKSILTGQSKCAETNRDPLSISLTKAVNRDTVLLKLLLFVSEGFCDPRNVFGK